jgi:hypothetical protein
MKNPLARLRRSSGDDHAGRPEGARGDRDQLAARVAALEVAVEENRRLNQRLADVVDVVTEVLVPAVDRDDERIAGALANLNKTLNEGASTDAG